MTDKAVQTIDETAGTAVVMTPADMIGQAVSQGASIEVLTKLMDLQDRYDAKQAVKAFDAAMAAAKPKFKKVKMSGIGHNKAPHETLVDLDDAIRDAFGEYGLSYGFETESDGDLIKVTCVISHLDGHSKRNSLQGKPDKSGNKNDIQAIGSVQTYLQRYTLKAGLGLAASKDDDGAGATGPMVLNSSQAKLFINFDLIAKTIREMPTFKRLENMRAFIETITFVHPSTVGIWLEECDARAEAMNAAQEAAAKQKLTGKVEEPAQEAPEPDTSRFDEILDDFERQVEGQTEEGISELCSEYRPLLEEASEAHWERYNDILGNLT